MIRKLFRSKFLVLSQIFSFVLLITIEAAPRNINHSSDKEFKPVVKVRQQQEIPEVQKRIFNRLIGEGKKLLQEDMDYEGAINKFKEAQNFAITKEQRADALFYLSLAHYATIDEIGDKGFVEAIRKLIEIDYYRELDSLLCPPRYAELFRGTKKEYGALRIQSKPSGADVYINDSKDSLGKTPVTIGAKAGEVKIRLKKGKQEKRDTIRIIAGKEITSETYILKGKSSLLYVIGGIVLAGGVGAALLGGGKGNGGTTPSPSPVPTTGSIQVNSNPIGAQVFLDGSNTGRTTNCTLTNVSPGSHSVKLVKDGFYDYEESVSVTAGQTTTVDATLTEIEWEGDYVFITKWGSNGTGDGQFGTPHGVAVDVAGYVYVADRDNRRIQKFTSDGIFVTKWGSQGTGNGQFERPVGIDVDDSNFVYVADQDNHCVQKFTSDGTFVTKWGSQGREDGLFEHPVEIAINASGHVFVVDRANHRIQKFTSDGVFLTKWDDPGSGDGQLWAPWGICVDGSGYVYVGDSGNNRIQKFTSDGVFVARWGSNGWKDGQFDGDLGIGVDGANQIYVADSYNHRIQKFTSDGTFVTKWGKQGMGDGEFNNPYGVCVDGSGYVYVADAATQRIQKFGPVSAVQKVTEMTYAPLNNHLLNRNLRPRPSLMNRPARDRLTKKQNLLDKKVRRGKGKDSK